MGYLGYSGGSLSARRYVHSDYLGSIIATSNDGGQLVDTYRYSIYGEVDDPSGMPYRFTGRRYDGETNLYYYRARWYSPALGRFMQTDPIGYGDDQNMYQYAFNDPINAKDPSGEEVRLTWHRVAGHFRHLAIRIIPEDQSRYANDARFSNLDSQSRAYSVLSAGPSREDRLVSGINRSSDLGRQEGSRRITIPSQYGSENDFIDALFEAYSNYDNSLDYDLFPDFNGEGLSIKLGKETYNPGDGYNSNSYAIGLLRALGLDGNDFGFVDPNNFPGVGKPVEPQKFDCVGSRISHTSCGQ